LANIGHPQSATPLFCDNEVAIGIAADTVSQRMSKATDMRLHWIRDRVRQGHFRVFHPRSPKRRRFFSPSLSLSPVIASFIAADPADDDSTIALNNLSISTILFPASY
jgi:hypothetical protein